MFDNETGHILAFFQTKRKDRIFSGGFTLNFATMKCGPVSCWVDVPWKFLELATMMISHVLMQIIFFRTNSHRCKFVYAVVATVNSTKNGSHKGLSVWKTCVLTEPLHNSSRHCLDTLHRAVGNEAPGKIIWMVLYGGLRLWMTCIRNKTQKNIQQAKRNQKKVSIYLEDFFTGT